MQHRTLGKTGLNVSVLGHGAMEIRGTRVWGGRPVTDEEASRILNAVLDAGINFVDTSYDYGQSEDHIGKHIAHRRGEYYLATKCGCTFVDKGDHDETPHVWTRANLLHNIETSLKRMKTDYIDLWQLHNSTPEQTDAEDLVSVMQQVQQQGKVRHVGISSTLPHITPYVCRGVFSSFQIPYSALERRHEDAITQAAQSGAGTIIRGGVAKGEYAQGSTATDRWSYWQKAKLDDLLSPGESRSAFLLRFTITHPHMHTTIVGTKNPQHLQENVKAARAGALSQEVYAEAKRRLDKAGQTVEAV